MIDHGRETGALNTVFDSFPEMIYVADPETHEVLFLNQKYRDTLGHNPVGGKCFRDLRGFEEPCDFCTNNIILQQKGRPYEWEYHNSLQDRTYQVTDQIIPWPDGRDVRFERATDITERKKEEVHARILNSVLPAIREVNQVLAGENDRTRLIEAVCACVKGCEGVSAAWVILTDRLPETIGAAQSGFKKTSFQKVLNNIGKGDLPLCCKRAVEEQSAVVSMNREQCSARCPLVGDPGEVSDFTACLTYQGHKYGFFCVSLPDEYADTGGKKYFVQEISRDIAFALYSTDRKVEIRGESDGSRQHRAGVEAPPGFALAAEAGDEFETAARSIFDACRNVVHATAGYVALLSKDGSQNDVLFLESGGLPCTVDPSLPMPVRGLRAEAYRKRKPVYDNNFSESEWQKYMPEGHVLLENVLFVPLVLDGSAVGLLGLANKEGGFTENDAQLADVFGRQAAVALRNAVNGEVLKKSEKRYRLLFENLSIGMYRTSPKNRILDVNPAYRSIVGCDEKRNIQEEDIREVYVDPRDRECIQEQLEKTGFIQGMESRWRRADGDIIWVRENIHVFEDDRGQRYYEGVVEDITDRKRTEQELYDTIRELKRVRATLEQQAEWITALNSVSSDIARKNSTDSILRVVMYYLEKKFDMVSGGIGFYNPSSHTYTVRIMSTRGRDTAARLGIEEGGILEESHLMFSTVRTGDGAYTVDVKDTDQESLRIIVIPLTPERTRLGILFMIVGEVADLSEPEWGFLNGMAEYVSLSLQNRKLYEELENSYSRLEKAQAAMMEQERMKAMGQVASGITHDINNTLAPIAMYTEILLDGSEPLSDRARKYLTTIQTAVGDIENVTMRLRTFYKHDEERDFRIIEIDELIRDVIDLSRPRWKDIPNKKGFVITIESEIKRGLPPLLGSISEIREALINLVFNAVDAMPEGGTILFRAGTDGRFITIEIKDTGTGMDEEQKARCLEPFFSTKGSAGSGLGLTMVQGMVQRHSGRIVIESELGAGTCIRLLFPLSHQDKQEVLQGRPSIALPKLDILYVDDDERIQDVMREMLTRDGHDVRVCSNGGEALDVFREHYAQGSVFNLVITDMGMPYMDGKVLARKIKEISPDTPVILLSGWGSLIKANGELPDNIDYLLGKPPRMGILKSAILEVLSRGCSPL